MFSLTSPVVLTFIVYLLLMLLIGYVAYQRTKDASDYFVGGRSLGPWPTALSAGASDMSGWLLLGLPGYAVVSGFEAIWLAIGLLLGTWANWKFSAARLRLATERVGDAITLPEYFSRRFYGKKHLLQIVSAVFILIFFLFYTSSGLVAGAKLFETVFGLPYTWAVFIGTACIVSYTLFGGFLAVSWTDLVQGLLMAAALLLVPIITLQSIGDVGLFTAMNMINPQLLDITSDSVGAPLGFITILSLLSWGLGYFGQPHILARFAAIKDIKDVKLARRIAVTWSGLSMTGALFVGFTGLVFVHQHPQFSLPDSEGVFMLLVGALFHPIIAGILLAAILAAVMSTADSQLLVSSSALAEDIYKAYIKKDASREHVMLIGRLAVVVIAVIAALLALNSHSTVLGLVSYAWAGFGAAFGPAILFSLYWRNMSGNGALAGIVVGGLTVLIWKHLSGGIFDLYELLPGFVFSSLAIIYFTNHSSSDDDSEEYFEELIEGLHEGQDL